MVSAGILEEMKPWVTQKLSAITDADVEPLSAYVVALLSSDLSLDRLSVTCFDSLRDFLRESTGPFVEDLMTELDKHLNVAVKVEPHESADFEAANEMQTSVASTAGSSIETVNGQTEFRRNFRSAGSDDIGFSGQHRLQQQQQEQRGYGSQEEPLQPHPNGLPNQPMFLPPPPFIPGPFDTGFPPAMVVPNGSGQISSPLRRSTNGKRRGGGKAPKNSRFTERQVGPDDEYRKKKLIVEKIPDDKLDKDLLQEYFSKFGELVKISLFKGRRMAELEYASHDQARAAWSSPEPIFNNRFIKVYYKKSAEGEEEPVDIAAVKVIQEQRQKAYEEKLAKRQEHKQKMEHLISIKSKILAEQENLLKIAAENGVEGLEEIQARVSTENLKRQLTELQQEANLLGINTNPKDFSAPARGAYRGRGARGRGGLHPYRGGHRANYSPRAEMPKKLSLDFRPKTVQLNNFPAGQEENLNAYLTTIGGLEDISEVVVGGSSCVRVRFSQRYQAERLFFTKEIPYIGELQKEWIRDTDNHISGVTDTHISGDTDTHISVKSEANE